MVLVTAFHTNLKRKNVLSIDRASDSIFVWHGGITQKKGIRCTVEFRIVHCVTGHIAHLTAGWDVTKFLKSARKSQKICLWHCYILLTPMCAFETFAILIASSAK